MSNYTYANKYSIPPHLNQKNLKDVVSLYRCSKKAKIRDIVLMISLILVFSVILVPMIISVITDGYDSLVFFILSLLFCSTVFLLLLWALISSIKERKMLESSINDYGNYTLKEYVAKKVEIVEGTDLDYSKYIYLSDKSGVSIRMSMIEHKNCSSFFFRNAEAGKRVYVINILGIDTLMLLEGETEYDDDLKSIIIA